MKFVELRLDGFGKLVDCAFTFAPGINLIFGPNEAGKSTLQQALLTLLYGFYEEGAVTKAKRETAQLLAPWATEADFSGRLLYQLDDGQAFRVIRSFSGRPDTRLETVTDGQDISSEFRSASQGRLFFADEQLGMSKAVFENTCVMRQAELIALEESARAITDTLMRLSASGSLDTTTADALGILDKALRDEIGSERAWTKPLAQARKRLEDLQVARQQTSQARREAFAQIAELNRERSELEALDLDIERLDFLASLAEGQAIETQLRDSIRADQEAERLAEEVARLQPWADFPAHLRDQVIRLDAERTRLAEEISAEAPRLSEVKQRRATLADKIKSGAAKLADLVDAKNVPAERLPDVQKLAAKWESAQVAGQAAETRHRQAEERLTQIEDALAKGRSSLAGIVDLGVMGLAQQQQQWNAARKRLAQAQAALQESWAAWEQVGLAEDQFQALAETAQKFEMGTYTEEPPKGCRFWRRPQAPVGPPPEVNIYADVKPIRDRWQAARAEAGLAKEDLAAVQKEVRHHLGLGADQQLHQDHFEAAGQQLAAYTRLLSDVGVQRQAMSDAQAEAQNARDAAKLARDRLSQALSTMGYVVIDLLSAMHSFEKQCQRKAQYEKADADLERLQAEDRLLAREDEAQSSREISLRTACQSLRATLTQAGITVVEDDLADAVAKFEEQHRHHQRWLRAQEKHQAALARPASGLTQQDRDAARKRLADLQRELEEWLTAHPKWANLEADRDAHEYRERGRELEGARQARQQRCTQLRESLQRMMAKLSHPAELAEEIAAAEARVRRLVSLGDVLALARDELEAATQEYQRAFAPRLEELLADGLARATQGRYAQVGVDPSTLAVTLVAPERNEPVAAARLSTGTRDLIYLLLRIGVARLMSRTGETLPLLLDDPLVQLDRHRQAHTLRLLSSLAAETQIILFTKDDDILRWFQDELAGDRRHRLQALE